MPGNDVGNNDVMVCLYCMLQDAACWNGNVGGWGVWAAVSTHRSLVTWCTSADVYLRASANVAINARGWLSSTCQISVTAKCWCAKSSVVETAQTT